MRHAELAKHLARSGSALAETLMLCARFVRTKVPSARRTSEVVQKSPFRLQGFFRLRSCFAKRSIHAAQDGDFQSGSAKTSAVKASIFAPVCQALGGKPAFLQVCSRNVVRSHSCSTGT